MNSPQFTKLMEKYGGHTPLSDVERDLEHPDGCWWVLGRAGISIPQAVRIAEYQMLCNDLWAVYPHKDIYTPQSRTDNHVHTDMNGSLESIHWFGTLEQCRGILELQKEINP